MLAQGEFQKPQDQNVCRIVRAELGLRGGTSLQRPQRQELLWSHCVSPGPLLALWLPSLCSWISELGICRAQTGWSPPGTPMGWSMSQQACAWKSNLSVPRKLKTFFRHDFGRCFHSFLISFAPHDALSIYCG